MEPQPSLSREPRQKRPQHRHDEHIGSRERPKARLYRYAESRNDNGELAACNEFYARPETPSRVNACTTSRPVPCQYLRESRNRS